MVGARLANTGDLQIAEALRKEALLQVVTERDGELFLSSDVDQPGGELLSTATDMSSSLRLVLGEVNGTAVGYGIVELTAPKATLSELFTLPTCRGVGVGDAMLSFIQGIAREAGCTHLDSRALPGDRGTKNFFEAHGMKARLITTSGPL